MKINNELERLIALQQGGANALQGQQQIDPEKFAGLLGEQFQEQISGNAASGDTLNALSTSSQLLNASMLGLSAVDTADQQANRTALASVFDNYNQMLAGLDDYGSQLSRTESDLRSAWNALESLSSQVAGLRSALAGLSDNPEEVAGLVSEMEVLVATEQFKFNRGDYL